MFLKICGGLCGVWICCENSCIVSEDAEDCLSDWGRSAVYNVYRNGPSMLPWGAPESIGNKDDVLLLSETEKYLSLS